jgi:tyrosyl-tRNA synthetase
MDSLEKIEIIKENLAEVIGSQDLEKIINEGKNLKVYWGTSPTGKPHLGYFLPMIKIAQLVKAGCEVTILFADLHAYLDSMKTSWELLDYRTKYYEHLIKQLLLLFNVDLNKIKFVRGSEYQLTKEYTIDVYKLMSKITVDSAQKGGAEVVKQSDNPLLSGLIYPILQILDEVYLKTDAELGGLDQRKIFMMSRDHLHKIGYKSNIHLMNPMIPNITAKTTNEKMSSSEPNSKIDLLDNPKTIKKKINKAWSEPKNPENGLFTFLKNAIFPILKLKQIDEFIINRDEKWGGKMIYTTYDKMVEDYKEDILTPQDLKLGIIDWLNDLLKPLQEYFNNEEMLELIRKSYD